MANVFWIGSDGNRWVADGSGTRNVGAATAEGGNYWTQQGYSQIADPNPGTTSRVSDLSQPSSDGLYGQVDTGGYPDGNTAPVASTFGPTGGTAPAAPVGPTEAQLSPLMASLAQLGSIHANKNQQSQSEYNKAIAGYNEQDALDRTAYKENVTQNESSYTGNNQAALLNAANASTGLRGVLSGLGGLAGSGADVVSRLVGLAANKDTGASRQNFDVNATGLNTAWGNAEREQRQRREDASSTLENNKQNNEASVLTARQGIYQQLANLYGADHAKGGEYASKAAALAAPIANTTRASVSPYAKASASYSPQALKQYLAGTQNLNVDTTAQAGGSTVPTNSPLFNREREKEQLNGVA